MWGGEHRYHGCARTLHEAVPQLANSHLTHMHILYMTKRMRAACIPLSHSLQYFVCMLKTKYLPQNAICLLIIAILRLNKVSSFIEVHDK